MHINTSSEGAKNSQALFSSAQGWDKKQWAQPETQEAPSEHLKLNPI